MEVLMIYFDYAASCPLDKEAAETYIKAATDYFGNSKSLHDIGNKAYNLLEYSRAQLSSVLGIDKDGLYFTSGGSESNFLGIQTLKGSPLKNGKHMISTSAEHSSVGNTLEKLKEEGYDITYLDFNQDGVIDLMELEKAIRKDTILITVQHGNPEIGTIQPISEISTLCQKNDILLHSDCVQTFGKQDLKTISKLVDSFSISGHKIYGPKGIGALYLSPKRAWKPYYPGTSHEGGIRPGTVNVPAIAAMTVAAVKMEKMREQLHEHYQILRRQLLQQLETMDSRFIFYEFNNQLPSTIGMRVKGIEGQWMMLELNRLGFAISTGSACQIGLLSPSKTMKALGVTGKKAKEFIRISFGKMTSINDVKQLGEAILSIVENAEIKV